ncbi:MAG TPA: aminotransferase class V-fold PLP-dependent enzyme [Verrucomicrobiae bacterium]
MTLEELQSNEELRNHEFPITREKTYLAHAAVCPLPRRVSEAISNYAIGSSAIQQEAVMAPGWLTETRQLAAKFLGVKMEEVAFVGPTSNALSMFAAGLSFKRNQNILIYGDDYPSNVYPWMKLAERGVQVRYLNIRELGIIRARDVIGQVDENTRLVAISSCHFLSGYRAEIDEIGKYLRKRGVLLSVDAIQTLGAFETPLANVDFAAADAHKWLLGPCAAGLMYVRHDVQERVEPTAFGWHNVRTPNFVTQEEINYKPDARRYEAGTHNLLGIVGIRAALELLLEVDLELIGRELARKRAWLVPELEGKGYTVLNAKASPANASGIVSFFKAGADMGELHGLLERHNVITNLRVDREGQKYIRVSPHFYNTDTELRRVLELL